MPLPRPQAHYAGPGAAGPQAGVTGVPGYGLSKAAGAASQDTKQALKMLLADPVGGQSKALELLGDGRALAVGMVLIGVFVLTAYLAGMAMLAPLLRMARQFGGSVDVRTHLKLLLLACVPAAAILAGLVIIGKIFGGRTSFHSALFCTGVVVLPGSIALAATWLLGLGNAELVLLVTFFAGTITILLANSALTSVQKLPAGRAMWLTPALLVLSAYISKVLYMSLFR